MKKIEIYFGNSEQQKNAVIDIWNKYFKDSVFEFRTANEDPFSDEISYYGSVEIKEAESKIFDSFFSEYYQFIK